MVEFLGDRTLDHLDKVTDRLVVKFLVVPMGVLWGLAIVVKANWENDMSIASVTTMDLTYSTITRIQLI